VQVTTLVQCNTDALSTPIHMYTSTRIQFVQVIVQCVNPVQNSESLKCRSVEYLLQQHF
jgi:hypothetical protein